MNLSETVYMIFSKPSQRSNAELNIKLGAKKITRVDSVKFLGQLIDETLRREHHINYITKKIGSLVVSCTGLGVYSHKLRWSP